MIIMTEIVDEMIIVIIIVHPVIKILVYLNQNHLFVQKIEKNHLVHHQVQLLHLVHDHIHRHHLLPLHPHPHRPVHHQVVHLDRKYLFNLSMIHCIIFIYRKSPSERQERTRTPPTRKRLPTPPNPEDENLFVALPTAKSREQPERKLIKIELAKATPLPPSTSPGKIFDLNF